MGVRFCGRGTCCSMHPSVWDSYTRAPPPIYVIVFLAQTKKQIRRTTSHGAVRCLLGIPDVQTNCTSGRAAGGGIYCGPSPPPRALVPSDGRGGPRSLAVVAHAAHTFPSTPTIAPPKARVRICCCCSVVPLCCPGEHTITKIAQGTRSRKDVDVRFGRIFPLGRIFPHFGFACSRKGGHQEGQFGWSSSVFVMVGPVLTTPPWTILLRPPPFADRQAI